MLKYLRQSSGMDFIDGLMHKRVYKFEEYRDTEHISMIFGKKGTNLCRIVKIGIPVPPGFIISSEAYFDYLKDGAKIYDKLEETYSEIILDWESNTGRRFNPFSQDLDEMDKFPILLSVRPSCGVADLASVPSSVLNIGLNDEIVQYIIQITGNKFFAYDLYRRFLQQFGTIVLGIRLSSYTNIEQHILHEENVSDVFSLSEDGIERLVGRFKEITDAPADGTQQLLMTIDAMYEWWIRNHPEEKSLTFGMSGISIIVQEMVHGNINHSSGSGIAYCTPFTRGIFGSEVDGQELKSEEEKKGSDIEALDHLKSTNPDVYEQVVEYAQAIKREFSENDEDSKISIDFTIQNGIVFVLEVKDQNKIAQLLSFVAAVDSS